MTDTTPTGWKCPGCGRCWAPYVEACGHCAEKQLRFEQDTYETPVWRKYVLPPIDQGQWPTSTCPNPMEPYVAELPYWPYRSSAGARA